mgnify:CR=1 FL=1
MWLYWNPFITAITVIKVARPIVIPPKRAMKINLDMLFLEERYFFEINKENFTLFNISLFLNIYYSNKITPIDTLAPIEGTNSTIITLDSL